MPKTKCMVSGEGLDALENEGKYPVLFAVRVLDATPSTAPVVYNGSTINAASSKAELRKILTMSAQDAGV